MFVQQKLASPSEILLLTFTNKAAGEMKNRMDDLLKVKTSRRGVSADNQIFAGTFQFFRLPGSQNLWQAFGSFF